MLLSKNTLADPALVNTVGACAIYEVAGLRQSARTRGNDFLWSVESHQAFIDDTLFTLPKAVWVSGSIANDGTAAYLLTLKASTSPTTAPTHGLPRKIRLAETGTPSNVHNSSYANEIFITADTIGNMRSTSA